MRFHMTRLFAVDKRGTTYIGRPKTGMGPESNPLLLNDVVTVPTCNLTDGLGYSHLAKTIYNNDKMEKEKEIRIDGLEKVTHFLE